MELYHRKIKDNIKHLKKKSRNGSVMSAHVACAKRKFNMLALLTKN